MSQAAFSQDWLKQFTDPYAILGLSVAADERRILKRYHQVAKQLHPDIYDNKSAEQQEFVTQVLSKLVNPAYQRLKQDKGRNEVLATLRFKVRRLSRENQLHPQSDLGNQLFKVAEPEIEIFYEQSLTQLSNHQYHSMQDFNTATLQIAELNLIYLRRKMGDTIIREKRTGLVAATSVTSAPVTAETKSVKATLNYAERHYQRAQDYIAAKNYPAAIQELKDALKIEPQNSTFHCLIGQTYLLHQLPGMAKVHIKQSLRLNPNNPVALKYARQLKLEMVSSPSTTTTQTRPAASSTKAPPKSGLFGNLFSKG